MRKFSHQFLIAITVESTEPNPAKLSVNALTAGVASRLEQIILHDGLEAFSHCDTEEI